MLETISSRLLLVLVAVLPFEFRNFPVMSNLQWLFLLAVLPGLPAFVRNWRKIIGDRFVQLAIVFVLTQWTAALFAGENVMNSLKAASRVSAGLMLFCAAWVPQDRNTIFKWWSVASLAAAVYGLADYAGFGAPQLFREDQFYFGEEIRLSGSFEYPTTAAAYYAMSLPIMVVAPLPLPIRILGGFLLWVALILTYSRGAAIAAAIALIVGFGIARRATAIRLAFAGLGSFALIAFLQPELVARYADVRSGKTVGVTFQPEFNSIAQRPGTMDSMTVKLLNSGIETWRAHGKSQVVLSYYWYDTNRKYILPGSPIETLLPKDVASGEHLTLTAAFRTPDEAGLYLMDWDLKRKDKGWFAPEYKLSPAVVESRIEQRAAPAKMNADVSRWYDRGPDHVVTIDASVSRADLWKAAFSLVKASPILGWGPDSFRLLYGAQLGAGRWDENIRSNSLYFELLVGSGLIGLAAFAVMLVAVRWTRDAASMAAGVFLLHGTVDVLLMTTPIYFGFWILLGLAHENRI